MVDDQALPPETAQIPVNEPLSEPIPPAQSERAPEPPEAASPSEPAEPVSEATPEAAAAEPQSESAAEPEPAPRTQGAASAAPSATPRNTPEHNRELLVKARATRQSQKQQKLDKIMAELEKRGKITNDEVEKLLRCSDPTATRYLSALEKEGKIKQLGKTGKAVTYTKP